MCSLYLESGSEEREPSCFLDTHVSCAEMVVANMGVWGMDEGCSFAFEGQQS